MFSIRRVQLSPALALYDAIQSLFFVDHLPGVHRDETCSSVPDRENYHLGAGSTLTLIVAVERAVGNTGTGRRALVNPSLVAFSSEESSQLRRH